MGLGTNVVGRVTSFLGSAFIVVLCTVFMLTEARMFGRRLSLIGEARGPNFERMLHAGKDIQRFLGIKTMVSLATGFLAKRGLGAEFRGLAEFRGMARNSAE